MNKKSVILLITSICIFSLVRYSSQDFVNEVIHINNDDKKILIIRDFNYENNELINMTSYYSENYHEANSVFMDYLQEVGLKKIDEKPQEPMIVLREFTLIYVSEQKVDENRTYLNEQYEQLLFMTDQSHYYLSTYSSHQNSLTGIFEVMNPDKLKNVITFYDNIKEKF